MTGAISDDVIAARLRDMAAARAPATLCPSEVARALASDWRPLMDRVRCIAAGLPEIAVTQGGAEVDPALARGPIRLSLRRDRQIDDPNPGESG